MKCIYSLQLSVLIRLETQVIIALCRKTLWCYMMARICTDLPTNLTCQTTVGKKVIFIINKDKWEKQRGKKNIQDCLEFMRRWCFYEGITDSLELLCTFSVQCLHSLSVVFISVTYKSKCTKVKAKKRLMEVWDEWMKTLLLLHQDWELK